jgi:K+-transporting ATPase ATPase C chain
MLKHQLRPAISVTIVLMVITGLIYPGLVTAMAQVLFPRQANGSLIMRGGRVIGSLLVGQQFARAEYFHARPSSAGAGYDGGASGGSNKGPTDRTLADSLITEAVDSEVKLDGAVRGRVPSDLVTRSGSGLDPDISPASAFLQVPRVARARGLDSEVVWELVTRHVQRRALGFLGDPHVNVLRLNLALDSLEGGSSRQTRVRQAAPGAPPEAHRFSATGPPGR